MPKYKGCRSKEYIPVLLIPSAICLCVFLPEVLGITNQDVLRIESGGKFFNNRDEMKHLNYSANTAVDKRKVVYEVPQQYELTNKSTSHYEVAPESVS